MDIKTYQFTVVFEQDEDGVFIATVPALQGCNSFGSTLEDAEKILKALLKDTWKHYKKLATRFPNRKTPILFL